MKKVFILLAILCLPLLAQIKGRLPIYCGQFANSYNKAAIGSTTSSLVPWRIWVDTVFVDTTGNGTFKKIGTGGDTTKAIYVGGNLGFFTFAGTRTVGDDSGSFGIKPLCWSKVSRNWITPANIQCDTLNLKCDTTLITAVKSGGFAIDRTLSASCDSVKMVLYSLGVAGTSNSDTIRVGRLGVCAY